MQALPAGPGGQVRRAAVAMRARRAWQPLFALLAIALLLGAVSAPGVANAAGSRAPERAEKSLFHREQFRFSWQTVERIRNGIVSLPTRAPEIMAAMRRRARALGMTGSALVLFLLIAVAYGLFGRRRFIHWAQDKLLPLAERLPPDAAPWLLAVVLVAAAVLIPLSLWLLYELVATATKLAGPGFLVLGTFLVAWTVYALLTASAHELLVRPLLQIAPEHGRYLFRMGRWLLRYAVAAMVVLDAALKMGAPADVVELFRWVFKFTLLVLFGFGFARRRAVMALFPDLPNRPYRRFVRAFDRLYPVILMLTLGTALLQLAGFRLLADSIWVRTWAVMGVFVGAVLLHHLLRLGLAHTILGSRPEAESARNFYRSAGRLLDYLGSVAVALILLHITGLWRPVIDLLSVPLGKIGERPLSFLILVEAAIIVAAFIFAAKLLRDYLEFHVYPRFNVDAGIAHAINTFLVYALTIIGAIAALEAVGLGLGTITLFAGAFGIGLGFGLQSFANNLASGLTLIFSRALRKGDVVTVGETIGVIQEVGMRATRMRTRDDVEYLVPNSEFVSGKVVNWTRTNPYTRLHVSLGVSYDADPGRVREILESVAARTPNVEQSPSPEVWFAGFGDSTLNFQLLVWINIRMVQRQKVASDLYFAIFTAFKEAGIELPFPQRDLHIRSAEGLVALDRKRGGEPESR